jgi:hypothetical protein
MFTTSTRVIVMSIFLIFFDMMLVSCLSDEHEDLDSGGQYID